MRRRPGCSGSTEILQLQVLLWIYYKTFYSSTPIFFFFFFVWTQLSYIIYHHQSSTKKGVQNGSFYIQWSHIQQLDCELTFKTNIWSWEYLPFAFCCWSAAVEDEQMKHTCWIPPVVLTQHLHLCFISSLSLPCSQWFCQHLLLLSSLSTCVWRPPVPSTVHSTLSVSQLCI